MRTAWVFRCSSHWQPESFTASDIVWGAVRQAVELFYLGLKIHGRIKKQVEILFSDEQRQATSRGMTEGPEQLLGMVRREVCSDEEQLYLLSHPKARAEDTRRREAELEVSTAKKQHQGGFQLISLVILPILPILVSSTLR